MKTLRGFSYFLLFLFYGPLILLILQSLMNFEAFFLVFQNESNKTATMNSLTLAFFTSIFSWMGAMLVIFFKLKKSAQGFLYVMGVPEILMALSLLLVFLLFQKPLGFQVLLLAHFLLVTPFSYVILKMAWDQIPQDVLEAARDLGATPSEVFKKVQLPLMLPASIASLILSFLLSFDDFILSFYLGGVDFETLPVKILTSLKIGLSAELKALSSLLLVVSFGLLFFVAHRVKNLKAKEIS